MEKTRRQEPRVREALAAIMEEYKPRSAQEAQAVLRELFAGTLEDMLKAELDEHLGYKRHLQEAKATGNRRNGTSSKSVRTSMGEMELAIPRDRDGEFEPAAVPKNKRDVSEIEEKVIKMYGRGTSDRDISATIDDIYGFKLSHETISDITEAVLPRVREWRERPLQAVYPFIFIDALYADVKEERASKKKAVYAIVGIDADGHKDVLGFWIRETEGAKEWLNIFDGLKARGVKRVSFVSADGLKGVEEAARTAFGDGMTFQRCIVHLVRNSLKYVPSKHYKEFCADLKAVYSAPDAEAARLAFGDLEEKWGADYPRRGSRLARELCPCRATVRLPGGDT
jgi:transposase-like protein